MTTSEKIINTSNLLVEYSKEGKDCTDVIKHLAELNVLYARKCTTLISDEILLASGFKKGREVQYCIDEGLRFAYGFETEMGGFAIYDNEYGWEIKAEYAGKNGENVRIDRIQSVAELEALFVVLGLDLDIIID